MANKEHLDILAKGVETWNEWRGGHPEVRPELGGANLMNAMLADVNLADANLARADLSSADLSGANLRRADLSLSRLGIANLDHAILEGANLCGADINGADLPDANLRDASLEDAALWGATLTGVDLTGANLSGANFTGANLAYADLSSAWIGTTVLADVDLSKVHGLTSVRHDSPSSIGIDTIYRSQGKIPDSFLRGAGVPENFTLFLRSLTGAAFEFYSCFISYSTEDQAFADQLRAHLQARGVRCWFAPHDIQGGKKIHEQIDEAVKVYDKLLLILSDASMSSNWVKTEIANARAKEAQQKRQMLFPISLVPFERIKAWKLFDADTGIDSAREIREYYVPDFSNWKDHDVYAKAFDLLVRSLKADSSRAASEAAP
jgi:hypothetical protein